MSTPATARLAERVRSRRWYHTIELAPGLSTPGWVDHRAVIERMPLPGSLAGMRCLDIAPREGFWSLEMVRRGAAEVVGLELVDDAPGSADGRARAAAARAELEQRRAGSALVAEALGSSTERLEMSVGELEPRALGTFDLALVGDVLTQLRDPIAALDRVRALCSGRLIVLHPISPALTLLLRGMPSAFLDARPAGGWWRPNVSGVIRMTECAGFVLDLPRQRFLVPAGEGRARPRRGARALLRSGTPPAQRSAARRFAGPAAGTPHCLLACSVHPALRAPAGD